MFQKLLPRERRFFEHFDRQTAVIQRGLDLFEEMLNDYSRRGELSKQIKNVENETDNAWGGIALRRCISLFAQYSCWVKMKCIFANCLGPLWGC